MTPLTQNTTVSLVALLNLMARGTTCRHNPHDATLPRGVNPQNLWTQWLLFRLLLFAAPRRRSIGLGAISNKCSDSLAAGSRGQITFSREFWARCCRSAFMQGLCRFKGHGLATCGQREVRRRTPLHFSLAGRSRSYL